MIIFIFSVFENKDRIILVMDCADGGELYDYINNNQLTERDARRIFRQIVSAIHYCHQVSEVLKLTKENMSRLMTKPTKWHMRPVKTQNSLGIPPVWSESLLSTWRKLGSLATHWAHSEDSDQTGRKPRLIWVFAGCTVILLVLSWGDTNIWRHEWGRKHRCMKV